MACWRRFGSHRIGTGRGRNRAFRSRRRKASSDETIGATIRRTLMLVIAAIMLLTPSVVTPTTSRAINATDVIVAVDTTGSMAVEDATYGSTEAITRIDAARKAVHDITSAIRTPVSLPCDSVPRALGRTAYARYSGHQQLGGHSAVEATSVSAGSSLDAPIDQLLLTAKSIREAHPDDAIVLYLITDGEQTSNVTRRTFSSLRQYLNDGFTVGVGSTEGGKIPVIADGVSAADANAADQWVTDPDTGEAGISKMDEQNLKDIADEISGTYVPVNASSALADQVSAKAQSNGEPLSPPKNALAPLQWSGRWQSHWQCCWRGNSARGSPYQGDCYEHRQDFSNARLPFGARIALAIAAAVLVLIAGVAGANLSATVTFNRATASLKANIKAAQDESTDMDTLTPSNSKPMPNSPRPTACARCCCRRSKMPSMPMPQPPHS